MTKKEIADVLSVLALHPKGTHFCVNGQQGGYVLNAERLRALCELGLWAHNEALEALVFVTAQSSGDPLSTKLSDCMAAMAQAALLHWPLDDVSLCEV